MLIYLSNRSIVNWPWGGFAGRFIRISPLSDVQVHAWSTPVEKCRWWSLFCLQMYSLWKKTDETKVLDSNRSICIQNSWFPFLFLKHWFLQMDSTKTIYILHTFQCDGPFLHLSHQTRRSRKILSSVCKIMLTFYIFARETEEHQQIYFYQFWSRGQGTSYELAINSYVDLLKT